MKNIFCLLALLLASCASEPEVNWQSHHRAQPPTPNTLVLASVDSMPVGKGYAATQKDVDRLAANVALIGHRFAQDLKKIGPTFCSGATYLVFLRTIDRLGLTASLSPKDLSLLADLDAPDGEKVFGRWNANGPGTAKLFRDLGCGANFTSFEHARPGDFLKLWWTNEIGGRERGHLVVYLGHNDQSLRFWSANEPNGYGRKSVPRSKIKHHLFSRLTQPSRLGRVTKLKPSDPFLTDMLRKDFSWAQVVKACRVTGTP